MSRTFDPICFALLSQALVSAARVEFVLGMKEVGSDGKSLIGTGQFHREEQVEPNGAGEIICQGCHHLLAKPSSSTRENKTSKHGHERIVSDLGSAVRGDSSYGVGVGGGLDKGFRRRVGDSSVELSQGNLEKCHHAGGSSRALRFGGSTSVWQSQSTLFSAIFEQSPFREWRGYHHGVKWPMPHKHPGS
jgi:hypothetical protein